MAYPIDVRVFLDGLDVTYQLFGTETINPTDDKNAWRDIDISDLIKSPGLHDLSITCDDGSGRVDARIEIR